MRISDWSSDVCSSDLQTIQDVRPVRPKGRNMVGPAYTLRYIPAREDLNQLDVFRNPEHPQRKAVEVCPPGAILVMDSRKDPRAASAGDILVTRLQMRGVAGVVTTGGFRDAMKIAALEIPAYPHQIGRPWGRETMWQNGKIPGGDDT